MARKQTPGAATAAPKKKPSHQKSAASQSPLSLERYSRPPVLDVPAAIALAKALLAAAPKNASAELKAAAKRLSDASDALAGSWKAKSTETTSPETRTADQQLDHAWASFHDRLAAYAALPAERHPRATRAKELQHLLFPNGTRFLKLAYDKEWAESQKVLDLVAEKGAQADLDSFAGPEFLAEVRLAHARYGVVLNITQPGQPPSPPKEVSQRLRTLVNLIPQYAMRVISAVDPSSPQSALEAEAALQPIVDAREVHELAMRRAKLERERKAEEAAKADAPEPPKTT